MSQETRCRLRSLLVKVLGPLALLGLIWCAGNTPAQAAGLLDNACLAPAPLTLKPNACFMAENVIVTYWSSAAHTKIVGQCSSGPCPGAGCTGTRSSLYTVSESSCEIC